MRELLARTAVLPSAGGVTRLARPGELRILKRAAMRIGVTVLATGERQTLEAYCWICRPGTMTALASGGLVRSRQRKGSLCVIESRCRLPRLLRMTSRTRRPQLPRVRIGVATRALAPQPEERVLRIFDLDLHLRFRRHILRRMAALAFLLAMFSFQRETCAGSVIEILAVQPDQLELLSVVFNVAARAVGFRSGRRVSPRVISGARVDAALDLDVTLQALESERAAAQPVTETALRDAIQTLVRPRKRTRRDLGGRGDATPKKGDGTNGRDVPDVTQLFLDPSAP